MKQNVLTPILFLFLTFGIISSCSKNANSISTPTLSVISINPNHGSFGDTVTITGSGFGSQDSVSFNGKLASVINASATQLQVTVPLLAGTGNIAVTANGNTASGPIFNYDTTYKLSTFATGFNMPEYLTIDAGGNLYVTNFNSQTVAKISPAGIVSTFASGLNGATGITIDANGNIYVATNSNLDTSTIVKISPSGTATPFASIRGYVYGLTMDNSGNVYAANAVAGAISKVNSSGTVSTFASGMAGISDIAVSSNGNLYATAQANGSVYKITPTGSVTGIMSGFNFGAPNGIVVDKNNNLYITILGSNPFSQLNTITKIDASGVVSTFTTGLDGPCGLIMDVNGNFFIVNTLNGNTVNGTVSKLAVQ